MIGKGTSMAAGITLMHTIDGSMRPFPGPPAQHRTYCRISPTGPHLVRGINTTHLRRKVVQDQPEALGLFPYLLARIKLSNWESDEDVACRNLRLLLGTLNSSEEAEEVSSRQQEQALSNYPMLRLRVQVAAVAMPPIARYSGTPNYRHRSNSR